MTSNKRWSLITVTYNSAEDLRKYAAGPLPTDVEWIVVDNHSSDATVTIVESFSDERITLHHNSVNLGGEGNFNRCIALARGKYTAIYHADDIYESEMVAAQVAFLEKHL